MHISKTTLKYCEMQNILKMFFSIRQYSLCSALRCSYQRMHSAVPTPVTQNDSTLSIYFLRAHLRKEATNKLGVDCGGNVRETVLTVLLARASEDVKNERAPDRKNGRVPAR